ncbi:hypothetical protein [Nitrososphaera viennensis]|uniref:Uncharacterized protein n=1 Tax=Nitrososphaera viennensis TaxID=1034015 RepID=A0A977ICU5_9ARCH|nr:hypothetical protein [Nitrososphaera viennensis]UVS68639.1 hypothetical protein NWT39_12120 [Nitrososphaera viennensis]
MMTVITTGTGFPAKKIVEACSLGCLDFPFFVATATTAAVAADFLYKISLLQVVYYDMPLHISERLEPLLAGKASVLIFSWQYFFYYDLLASRTQKGLQPGNGEISSIWAE